MNEEIKDNEGVQSDDIDQQNEQSEEIIRKVSINDEDENELPLSTPNGHESPVVTSFSDIIIEKSDESSEENHTPHDTHELLQIISDQSNKEANSTILNTVNEFFFLIKILNISFSSLSMEISM
jgi:hypothetical protein